MKSEIILFSFSNKTTTIFRISWNLKCQEPDLSMREKVKCLLISLHNYELYNNDQVIAIACFIAYDENKQLCQHARF